MMTEITYSGYRFPPEIIQQAFWLYLWFTLSFATSKIYLRNVVLRSPTKPRVRQVKRARLAGRGLEKVAGKLSSLFYAFFGLYRQRLWNPNHSRLSDRRMNLALKLMP
jgi:hypothetical protein